MGGGRAVEQFKNGIFVNSFDHAKQASDMLGINHPSSITACCRGKIKSVRGFQFQYKSDACIEGEIWLDHPIGIKVSSEGRFQFPGGHISIGSKHGLGYRQVHYKRKKYFAHRLILESFAGPSPEGMECDHIDRNRSNNAAINLRWVTKTENQANRSNSKKK
jgi:HNH endonuclease